MSTYKVIEVIGTSATSWEDAAAQAVKTAGETLHGLRVAEVVGQDIHLDGAAGSPSGPSFSFRSSTSTDPGSVRRATIPPVPTQINQGGGPARRCRRPTASLFWSNPGIKLLTGREHR